MKGIRHWVASVRAVAMLPDKALAFWFRQLHYLLQAGISLSQSTQLLTADIGNARQRQRLRRCLASLEQGRTFSEVMMQTGLFPPLAHQIIRAGERSGNLDAMCALLGAYYERRHVQRQALRQALAYPVFLIGCASILGIGAVFGIVPVFAEMFAQLGLPLPPATQALVGVVQGVHTHGPFLLAVLVALGIGVSYIGQQPAYRLLLCRYVLRLAIARRLALMVCWHRFSQILAIQLASGIPILDALKDAAAAVPFQWFRRDIDAARHALTQGASLSQAVRQRRLGTPYIDTMLRIGETTGRYEEALQSIQAYYGWQLQRWATAAQRSIGPAVLVVVGTGIGFLLISLLLPLLDAASGMGAL